MRAGEVALNVLVVLICVAPLMWFVGVPLERVGEAVGFWTMCFLIISWLGRHYESEE